MVYTEYFARGTAPTQYCDLHNSPGIFTKIASAIGIDAKPVSPNIEAIAMHPPPASPVHTSTAPPPKLETPPPPPEPEKRRGFWSRVFGRNKAGESRKPEAQKAELTPRDTIRSEERSCLFGTSSAIAG